MTARTEALRPVKITARQMLDSTGTKDLDLTAQDYDRIQFNYGRRRITVSFRTDDSRGPVLVISGDDQLTFRLQAANWMEILL